MNLISMLKWVSGWQLTIHKLRPVHIHVYSCATNSKEYVLYIHNLEIYQNILPFYNVK